MILDQYGVIEVNDDTKCTDCGSCAGGLLGWSQGQLARAAVIGLATLGRIEQAEGIVKGNFSTVLKIQKALEDSGIHFTDDDVGTIGVSLLKKKR